MARFDAQATVQSSLLGRLVAFAYAVWDDSGLNLILSWISRGFGRIFAGSFVGKVWYSNWPSSAVNSDSLIGRALHGVGEVVDRIGRRLGPFMVRLWEGSGLVRAGLAIQRSLAPMLESSLLWGIFRGYPEDVAQAPAEEQRSGVSSPLVFLLGAVLGLLPLVPTSFPVSPTVLMVAGIWGVALLWLARRFMYGGERWRASSAFLPLVVLLMVAAAATLQSVSLSASLLSFVIWLTAGLLFWLMVNMIRSSRDVAALLGPIMAGASLMAVWALYQYFVPPVIEETWVDVTTSGELVRSFASMGNPNYLAEYMALFLPLAVALWMQQPKRRWILSLPVLAMGLALLLTYSRGGYLAFAISLGIFMLMRFRRWAIPVALIGMAGMVFAPQSVINRIQTAVVDVRSMVSAVVAGKEIELADTSNTYRVNLWIGVLHMLAEFWYVGAGLGAEAFALVYQEFMLSGARAAHSHNTYLQVFAEMGVLGLIAMLWTLFAVIRRTFVVGVNARSALLVAAVPAALAGMLFHGLVEHIWYNPKLLFAFWAVAGLGMGLTMSHREDAAS